MVFRCNLDGSEFEVLAHNFRNNYEMAVDSYGTLWQSDNDDDGNRGVHINYVMEYGNYGYTDETTGAGWRTRRLTWLKIFRLAIRIRMIRDRFQTYYKPEPAHIRVSLFYEDDLMPEVFHNEMIRADAGLNVIRSYPVEKKRADYSAQIENVLTGTKDQWFHPSDVAVAPDGSIFVAVTGTIPASAVTSGDVFSALPRKKQLITSRD